LHSANSSERAHAKAAGPAKSSAEATAKATTKSASTAKSATSAAETATDQLEGALGAGNRLIIHRHGSALRNGTGGSWRPKRR
jgi:membrane protein involved in colicin uptake